MKSYRVVAKCYPRGYSPPHIASCLQFELAKCFQKVFLGVMQNNYHDIFPVRDILRAYRRAVNAQTLKHAVKHTSDRTRTNGYGIDVFNSKIIHII